MKYSDNPQVKNSPTQERSIKAIEDILESAGALSDEGLIELLNARNLAAKSGYSVGTIYRYFEKFDHIFLSLLSWRQKKAIAKVAALIDAHDPQVGINELVTQIVDIGLAEWSSKNPTVLKIIVRQFFRFSEEPEKFNAVADDALIPAIQAAQKRDQTNTFRQMTDNELRLHLRALQMSLRNPFIEGDPFAGSPEHRRCSIDMGSLLLGK